MSELVWIVATVNLPGLSVGTAALANPARASVQRRLASGTIRAATQDEAEELDRKAGRKGEQ